MARSVRGSFHEFGVHEGAGSARLTPADTDEVRHALALCREYGVVFALDGVSRASAFRGCPVLWVEPGSAMAGLQRLEDTPHWFVQAGCLLASLQDVGLRQFDDAPSHLTVAAWIADRELCDWPSGASFHSGLLTASVLLSDGTRARLGPFGAQDRRPLDALALQRMVPALFELSASPEGREFAAMEHWLPRYRLDALHPAGERAPNLAHLLLGHGGDLAWLEWAVFEVPEPEPDPRPYRPLYSLRRLDGGDLVSRSDAQDRAVKQLIDRHALFPDPGQEL